MIFFQQIISFPPHPTSHAHNRTSLTRVSFNLFLHLRAVFVCRSFRVSRQLKYLEELMDVDLILAKRGFAARAAQVKGACLPKAHADVANALKLQMASELDCSAYNWVPKSFWQTAFEPSEKPGGGAKGKSRPAV